MTNSYWDCKGKYQAASEKLEKMLPSSGAVENAVQNRALEKFRVATNCYYDLYNNGLCNRAGEFRKVFGLASSKFGSYANGFSDELYELVNQKMDKFVEAAAAEQGVELAA